MFIPKPIDKIDFNKNVLKINETTTIKFNKCDLDVELIESLISKGAYASTLLYLNSKCLVENINGEILTKESYSNYLQECKDLLKENVYETTASGFRQLCNINGLEVLENNKLVARGKTKLYVENFKEEYFPDLVMSIISEFNDSDMSRDDYMNALNKISELEWENKISTDEYDRANKKLNRLYIENRHKDVELVTESYVKIDKYLDIIDSIRNACEETGDDKEAVRTFLQTLNNEIKSLANSYDVLIEEINECEGTQTTDIAPKLDQEMNGLVEPPKTNKKLEEGKYVDWNDILEELWEDYFTEDIKNKMINDLGLSSEDDLLTKLINCDAHEFGELVTKYLGKDVAKNYIPYKKYLPKDIDESYDFNIGFNHNFKGFILTEQGRYERGNFVLINENGIVKAISKNKLKENTSKVKRAKIIDDYGNNVWDYDEVVNVQAPRLIKELNEKFGEEYDFDFRIEDDMLVVFDKNENFDFSYMDEAYDKANKIVKSLFGHDCYLEAQLSVIAVVAGMSVRDLN